MPTSSNDPASIARDYVKSVGRGDLEHVATLLHPQAEFTLGSTSTHTREEFLRPFHRLAPIVLRSDIRHIFVDGSEVCVVYDFVTDTPAGAVLSVELLAIEDDLITSSTLVFEKERWPEAIRELESRIAAAGAA